MTMTSKVYSSAGVGKTNSLPLMSYGRMSENASASSALPHTVAAGIEMRSLLGIDGGASSSPLIYSVSGKRNHQVTDCGTPSATAICSTKQDVSLQTTDPDLVTKEIQASAEVVTEGVQTVSPERSSVQVQTNGLYVPVEELMPCTDVDINSTGN